MYLVSDYYKVKIKISNMYTYYWISSPYVLRQWVDGSKLYGYVHLPTVYTPGWSVWCPQKWLNPQLFCRWCSSEKFLNYYQGLNPGCWKSFYQWMFVLQTNHSVSWNTYDSQNKQQLFSYTALIHGPCTATINDLLCLARPKSSTPLKLKPTSGHDS